MKLDDELKAALAWANSPIIDGFAWAKYVKTMREFIENILSKNRV